MVSHNPFLDRLRIRAHRYGDRRELIDRCAGVSLRCRELLARAGTRPPLARRDR